MLFYLDKAFLCHLSLPFVVLPRSVTWHILALAFFIVCGNLFWISLLSHIIQIIISLSGSEWATVHEFTLASESISLPNCAERAAFISGMAGRGAGPKQWLKIAANCCTTASFWRRVTEEGGAHYSTRLRTWRNTELMWVSCLWLTLEVRRMLNMRGKPTLTSSSQ